MRVEPEDVLIEQRLAARLRIEEREARDAVECEHEHGCREELCEGRGDERGTEDGPDENRQAAPGEAGRAPIDDGDEEVEATEDRREPEGNDGEVEEGLARSVLHAQRRIRRPPRVPATNRLRRE